VEKHGYFRRVPEETTVRRVPQHIIEITKTMFDNRLEFSLQVRTTFCNLGRDPDHATLENGELFIRLTRLPIACKVREETAVLPVNATWEPNTKHITLKCRFQFFGQPHVITFCDHLLFAARRC